MRNLYFILLLALTLNSCKKEILITSLPEATEVGQNSFGFLMEQNVWVPKWNDKSGWDLGCRELVVSFDLHLNTFQISAGITYKGKRSDFYMYVDSVSITTPFTKSAVISLSDSKGLFIKDGGDYSSICGPGSFVSITFTKNDTINKIISGKFEARLGKTMVTNLDLEDLYPNAPASITLSNGRFDVHYNYCR